MTTLKFTTKINAPKEKVWETLWNDTTYRKWTAAFMEGSYAESDWKEGSKILFLDGKGDGMFSMIEKKIPNQQMSFKHLGEVQKGIEKPADEKTESWAGSKENYYLKEINGVTELNVDMDSTEEFEKYFKDTFPKALEIVKGISEG